MADRLSADVLHHVIIPQQQTGPIWSRLLMWDGDGLLGDAVVLRTDETQPAKTNSTFPST